MQNLALKFTDADPANGAERTEEHAVALRLIESAEHNIYLFYRGNLYAQYHRGDHYSRNLIIAQLFLCHQVAQKTLSEVFHLTIPHLSYLINNYRRVGSAGIKDNTAVRIANNQKIKGKVATEITKQLSIETENRPTYECVRKSIKRKWGIDISAHRIGCWWRETQRAEQQSKEQKVPQQVDLVLATEIVEVPDTQHEAADEEVADQGGQGQWHPNVVAGSFILYALLAKSQFLKPFIDRIKGPWNKGKHSVERVMLTLYFIHALRLKSIEQTKHLLKEYFGPLVLGPFHRQQSLRYAIDTITEHKHFDQAVTQHYKNLGQQTELGDGIYYTDGHFSCYYGKYKVPKGYDPRRKQPARGRNTVYLHNSLGHNILFFESPTNTSLSVDIETLIEKMKQTYSSVKTKTLFFDRGGFSTDCFKKIKKEEMYFATYLKHRKKESEVEIELFEEIEIEINGKKIKNRIYEKETKTKHYGVVRTIVFIGKQGKQIPIITTNPNLSAAEIVVRLQKRWIEENGFKYEREHFNMDLLATYKTEQAPDKIMERDNPDRKAINREISAKKQALKTLKEDYSNQLDAVKEKQTLTIAAFEKQEEKLKFEIKHLEHEIEMLKLEKKDIPVKVKSNLKDECVITVQKRRMFINLVKCMNYNSEKWLQELFCIYHPKKDETLSLIRRVLTQPGRIRQRGQILEVELERLDSEVQANSLDKVLGNLKENNELTLPDGRQLAIWQAQ